MKRQLLSIAIAGCLAACSGGQQGPDDSQNEERDLRRATENPSADMAKPTGDQAGPLAENEPWIGAWSAERMDWNYTCDNGNKGSASTENLTSLDVQNGNLPDELEITQTDLDDPLTWRCKLTGATAKVVETIDDSSDDSNFGAHSTTAITVTTQSGEFTLGGNGKITTKWHIEYTQGIATCTEDITGTFSRL